MLNLFEEVKNANTIAISGHVRPDGDCVGASLAIWNYVNYKFQNKKCEVFLTQPMPNSFSFLSGFNEIKYEYKSGEYDLLIVCDCNNLSRLEEHEILGEHAKRIINIDHHELFNGPTPFAEKYVFPQASSTCELVYELIGDEDVTKKIAECIYTGIVHDTGIFQYDCCHRSTMNVAGALMEKGIDTNFIIDETYYRKTFVQTRIMGRALAKARLHENSILISSIITLKEMHEENASSKHMDGIANQLRITKGVRVALFMYETAPGSYKCSLRTNDDTDLNLIANTFGGGGHKKASGFTSDLSSEDIINKVIEEIKKQDV